LTVSLFMAGFAATPIVYGVLSDRYGRRPLLLTGLALFGLGGVICTFALSIGWLPGARFVQGGQERGPGPTIASQYWRRFF